MRRRLFGVCVWLVLVACAEASTPQSDPTQPAADVIDVRCDGTRTGVDDPLVQARSDGVHLVVHNSSGSTLLVGWSGGGDGAEPGDTRFVLPIPPGEGKIRCQPTSADPGAPGGWATFEVRAPDGWMSPEIDCPNGSVSGVRDYAEGARGAEDPLADAKDAADGADVMFAGYRTDDDVIVVALEDGVTTAVYGYVSDGHGGWLLSTTDACS